MRTLPSLVVSAFIVLISAAPATAIEIHHLHGVAFDPFDARVVYVATHTGLARWEEGKGWSMVGEEFPDLMGFSAHPRERGVMVASGHPPPRPGAVNPVGVVVSRDGGRTWKPLALQGQVDFHAMTVSRADGQTVYGWSGGPLRGLLKVSLADGTWRRIDARGLDGVLTLSAHPLERETLLAGTPTGLLRSRDGGRTWSRFGLLDVPVTAIDYSPSDPSQIYAYAHRQDLGLLLSPDGGKTWSALGLRLDEKDWVAALSVDSKSPGAVLVGTRHSSVLSSVDGGRTWRTLLNRGRPAD
jgi:hypothetical protein